MGKLYRETTGEVGNSRTSQEMRIFSQRPGRRNDQGKPIYTTEQAHKNECDVNRIIQKYDRTGLITHVSRFEAEFGDLTGLEFKAAQDKVANALSMFEQLPANIKKRFRNSPQDLLTFMEDPNNREEAIDLGLIDSRWTPETDGLGEHVKAGENVVKLDDKSTEPTPAG